MAISSYRSPPRTPRGVETLPPIHRDPFGRLLIAQARLEGMLLLTSDAVVARYSGPIRLV